MAESNYYPSIEVRGNTYLTTLRKKHTDGIWYDQLFVISGNDEKECTLRLRTEVYLSILYGIIDPNFKVVGPGGFEDFAFKKSEIQTEEVERMIPGYKIKIDSKKSIIENDGARDLISRIDFDIVRSILFFHAESRVSGEKLLEYFSTISIRKFLEDGFIKPIE